MLEHYLVTEPSHIGNIELDNPKENYRRYYNSRIIDRTKENILKKAGTFYEDFKEWYGECKKHGFIYSRQGRGKHGKPIMVHKFRSMYGDFNRFDMSNIKHDARGKIINDPRIMNFGKVLRKYWVDETPQLVYDWFIKGLCRIVTRKPRGSDLCLVGIRPRSDDDWNLFSEGYKEEMDDIDRGVFGINYADANITESSDISILEKCEKEFARKVRKNLRRTKTEYFFKILGNIIFKGMRSR